MWCNIEMFDGNTRSKIFLLLFKKIIHIVRDDFFGHMMHLVQDKGSICNKLAL